MQTIWAAQALLPAGWASEVRVEIGADGRIASVQTNQPQEGVRVGLLLPAPANVHSHAFQRAMAGLTESRGQDKTDSFWTWRRLMYQFLDRLTPDQVGAIAAFVQMEMLEAGYSACGEFHYLHHQPGGRRYDNLAEMSAQIAAAADTTGIGLCLLPVHYEFGGCDRRPLAGGQLRFGSGFDAFLKLHAAAAVPVAALGDDAQLAVAAHSLRAVSPDDLRSFSAHFPDGPIHMHLAEQLAEVEDVKHHMGARPVQWVLENMPIDERWCMIHCTQMTGDETRRLARTGAVAGLCPITESSLGDGIFDCRRWLQSQGAIGVGSDSNIRISLTEELRTLEYSQRLRDHHRAVLAGAEKSTGRNLFEEVLRGGATAIGRNAGKIAVGCWADVLALDTGSVHMWDRHGDAALDSWIFAGDDRVVQEVWSAGRHVVQQGQHVLRSQIAARFKQVLTALRDAL